MAPIGISWTQQAIMDAKGISLPRQFVCHYCDLPLVDAGGTDARDRTTSPPSHRREARLAPRVTQRHVRRLVAEKRVPYLKWRRFIRFDPRRDRHLAGQRPSAGSHPAPWEAIPVRCMSHHVCSRKGKSETETVPEVATGAPARLLRHSVSARTALMPVHGYGIEAWRMVEGPPKTDAGDRTLPIPAWL
jgi:hypothetical protein